VGGENISDFNRIMKHFSSNAEKLLLKLHYTVAKSSFRFGNINLATMRMKRHK